MPGVFSVFSEITVKEGKVNGYLKPLFKDVEAYDPEQDRDKGLLQKVYEKNDRRDFASAQKYASRGSRDKNHRGRTGGRPQVQHLGNGGDVDSECIF